MTTEFDDIVDDLFLGCALTAFLQVAIEQQAMPDTETTRCRAYRLYEEAHRDQDVGKLLPRLEP